jgi:hypothetical protein
MTGRLSQSYFKSAQLASELGASVKRALAKREPMELIKAFNQGLAKSPAVRFPVTKNQKLTKTRPFFPLFYAALCGVGLKRRSEKHGPLGGAVSVGT